MWKKIFSGAILLGLSSLLSRLLGVLRANQMATIFGTGNLTSAYYAAFALPDLIYALIVYGAVSSAFVPLFHQIQHKKGDVWEFTSAVLYAVILLTLVGCGILFLGADIFVSWLYPGFDIATQHTTAELLRILLLSPFLFGISAVCGSVQTAVGKFWNYALAPLVYNLAIIFGIMYFRDIYAVAWCTVLGAALHAGIQLAAVLYLGLRPRVNLRNQWQAIKDFFTLALPRIFALITTQINLLVDASIASLVPFGSLAVLRYAQDIGSFPMGIIGLSIATASFGHLSALAAKGDALAFAESFRRQFFVILYWMLPATLGLCLLRTEVTSVLLQGGVFTATDTTLVANTLAFLTLGLVATATIPLVARALYSQSDTRHPLYASLVSVTVNIVLSLSLYRTFGIYGLALASSLAALIQLLLLLYYLSRKISWRYLFSITLLGEILALSGTMALLVWLTQTTWHAPVEWGSLILYTAALSGIGGIIYLALSYLLGTWKQVFGK